MGISGGFLKEVTLKLRPERKVHCSKVKTETKDFLFCRSQCAGPEVRESTSCFKKMKCKEMVSREESRGVGEGYIMKGPVPHLRSTDCTLREGPA